jgi:hypothetical protein
MLYPTTREIDDFADHSMIWDSVNQKPEKTSAIVSLDRLCFSLYSNDRCGVSSVAASYRTDSQPDSLGVSY